MLSINDYLDNILIDFESYARSGVKLCDLKSVHYDAGRIPDYSSLHIQQLYLLASVYKGIHIKTTKNGLPTY